MGLIEELREAEEARMGSSLRNGCVDCGLTSRLASRAADQLERLRTKLKEVEWQGRIEESCFGGYATRMVCACPECEHEPKDGHADWCELGKLVKEG